MNEERKNLRTRTTRSGQNLKKVTERRFEKLHYILQEYPNIDVTGKLEFPTLIMDDCKMLYTYINNFTLHFLDELPESGKYPHPKTIFKYRISYNKKDIVPKENRFFKGYLKDHWKRIHTIKHKDTGLFLSGFTKTSHPPYQEKPTLVPVFSKTRKKYYMQRDYAQELSDKYPEYPLIII